ncbi:hypothetical protein BLNAU_21219 [Blattamonas nauphoetae]|uniref:Uncharacterized protein n=1 Tax=Blattamonas nauphoetae TaxID=2049346 RepID=A0ABQ9WYR8_9EUKA|nr:hypothetical protein BLNAU_21219 [Blattamonas nauphoetae]
MFLSLIVTFARIHSDRIDLLDVMKEYADDVSEIKLKDGEYFARDLHLKGRNLTFIGNVDTVTLDMRGFSEGTFDLENSSLTLLSICIKPPQLAVFAKSKFSELNMTACKFETIEMEYPILEGISSQLFVRNMTFTEVDFVYSLIQAAPGDNEAALSLYVQHCSFTRFKLLSQRPLLAGADVQRVHVRNTSFSEIKCTNVDPLPDGAIEGTRDRDVMFSQATISNVDGALSGALVFGIQASKLDLYEVVIEDSANAIRHSNNVAFAPKSEVFVKTVTTRFTTTTEIWPNGGFLYLPHNRSSLLIDNAYAYDSSAPNGSGGWVYVSGYTTLDIQWVRSKNMSAGKCGGFMYVGGVVEKLTFKVVDMLNSKAEENGGALFVSNADEIFISFGRFTSCGAIENGGAVFVDKADNTDVTIEKYDFTKCEASKGNGHDVLFSYENSTTYHVRKADFVKCTSTVIGYGVWFHPFDISTEWSDSGRLVTRLICIIAGVCGSIALALCILIPCLCHHCGCCVACGCGRKRKHAEYQHIEDQQPINISPPPQTTSSQPQQVDPSQPLLPSQNAPQTQFNSQQLPQQSLYTQPVDEQTQMPQYPDLPSQTDTDLLIVLLVL